MANEIRNVDMPDVSAAPRQFGQIGTPVAGAQKSEFDDFTKAKAHATSLVSNFATYVDKIEDNRKLRKALPDIAAMRRDGLLAEGQTALVIRQIDTNIANAIPPHIVYLKQSTRMAQFLPTDARLALSAYPVEYLEREFSRVMRYENWEIPYIRAIDGAALNGVAWLEVLYDETKPGKVSVACVQNEALIYNQCVDDIQSARMVLRQHTSTIVALRELARNNSFDKAAVKEVEDSYKDSEGSSSSSAEQIIYHAFYKTSEGTVRHGWFWKDGTMWLKAPSDFVNGVYEKNVEIDTNAGMSNIAATVPEKISYSAVVERTYPYFPKYQRITENPKLGEIEGRAALDEQTQDAMSTLLSAGVNTAIDSSNTMWMPENASVDEPTGKAPQQFSAEIKNGKVWDRPMKAFRSPAPDPMLFSAIKELATINREEAGQIAWTVQSRQRDSRKTAREIEAAQSQTQMMSGVDVLTTSLCLTTLFNYAWKIVQSSAIRNVITFCPDDQGRNRIELIEKAYVLRPSGDIDFIEREQMVNKMQQDWPVMQNTPLREMFLQEYIKSRYPTLADKMLVALGSSNQARELIKALASTIMQLVIEPGTGTLKPMFAPILPQLQALQQQVMAYEQTAAAQSGNAAAGNPQVDSQTVAQQ